MCHTVSPPEPTLTVMCHTVSPPEHTTVMWHTANRTHNSNVAYSKSNTQQ